MEKYQCIYEGKIAEIVTNLTNLKENFENFKINDFHEVKKNIDCIIEKMSKPRLPLWVTFIFTLCSGLIVGLIVAFVKS